jgi:hypothetical protein
MGIRLEGNSLEFTREERLDQKKRYIFQELSHAEQYVALHKYNTRLIP